MCIVFIVGKLNKEGRKESGKRREKREGGDNQEAKYEQEKFKRE
jgi:hypothetical protein